MGLARALRLGSGPADDCPETDEAGPVGHRPGDVQRLSKCGDVLGVRTVLVRPVDLLDVPPVGGVAGDGVLAERDVGVVFDGDAIAVVDQRQIAEPLGCGQRGCLGGDSLLDVPVGGKAVDVVIEYGRARRGIRIQQAALTSRRHGHAHRVSDSLAERSGGHLNPRRMPIFRMPWRPGVPFAQRLQVVQFEAEPTEIELDVEGQAGVPAGQYEAIPAGPLRIGRIVLHHALEQQVRRRSQAHRGARVPISSLLYGVSGQHPYGVDGA
jgi:hypothetical protein